MIAVFIAILVTLSVLVGFLLGVFFTTDYLSDDVDKKEIK